MKRILDYEVLGPRLSSAGDLIIFSLSRYPHFSFFFTVLAPGALLVADILHYKLATSLVENLAPPDEEGEGKELPRGRGW